MDADKCLQLFLDTQNRRVEEEFCKTFSEKNSVRLEFVHDNRAFTNGTLIHSDPQFKEIYQNQSVLRRAENYLGIAPKVSSDTWTALSMVTRAISIHECLHILYSDLSLSISGDVKCRGSKNKFFVMHHIWNTIEDSFIESYGASYYENIIGYLKFLNYSIAYSPDNEDEDCMEILDEETQKKVTNLMDYLSYMTWLLIYSPFKRNDNQNADIQSYIDKTKDLYFTGSLQTTSKKRYDYVRKIFDIILPLIPDDDKVYLNYGPMKKKFYSLSTDDLPLSGILGKPKSAECKPVKRRLFVDLDGNHINGDDERIREQLLMDIIDFESNKGNAQHRGNEQSVTLVILPTDYNITNVVVHKDIRINQNRIGTNHHLKPEYDHLMSECKTVINSYKSKVFDLLQAKSLVVNEKLRFGHGISSKHFGDPKKRFWYKKELGVDTPPLSCLFLIDGSGSMHGRRVRYSKIASVIMHEVLSVNNIEHCFAEHRAGLEEPEIDINILVDFNAPPSKKYNLMTLAAEGDNRDALALIWAERYLETNSSNENKVIIIISDGLPAHDYDHYYPPVSVQDTSQTVSRIIQRGTKVVAVALGLSVYDNLKPIYPYLIGCSDLTRLPAMLFGIIAKMLG